MSKFGVAVGIGAALISMSGTANAFWRIATNTPKVDGAVITQRAFHELSLAGLANSAGFRVVALRLADNAASDLPTHRGNERRLELPLQAGSVIELRDAADTRYEIQVVAHRAQRFLTGAPDAVTTHVLTWTSAAQPQAQPLCTGASNEAVLFTGDRYDTQRLSITATGAAVGGWVNLACADTALAKLYLTRHTEASQQTPTTRAQRQAMLKMLAADYYGDGRSFTVAGQPLLWAGVKELTRVDAQPTRVEAVWDEHGAVCLNVPRIPATEAAVAAYGQRPPRCDALRALPRGHVVSAHPL